MELINDIQLELTKIVVFKNSLMNSSEKYDLKKLIFISHVHSIDEWRYYFDGKYRKCTLVTLSDGTWFKCKDSYEEIKKTLTEWWGKSAEEVIDEIKK